MSRGYLGLQLANSFEPADALKLGLDRVQGGLVETVYANTPAAAAYLTSESPRRMLGYLSYSDRVLWQMWGHLGDAIREGTHRWKQTYGWDGPIFSHFFKDEAMKREFLFGMHCYGLLSSPLVVGAVDLARFKAFVDLGGATGHLAVAACRCSASASSAARSGRTGRQAPTTAPPGRASWPGRRWPAGWSAPCPA